MSYLNLDLRLLDVSLELFALKDYLDLIEKFIDDMKNAEKQILDAERKKQHLILDDPEWDEASWDYYHQIDFVIPHLFRGPFLVTLYAVYESAVIEIAGLIQKKQAQALSFDEYKSKKNFLARAKKYYKDILRFELCKDNKTWSRITMLSELRNAIAHSNGRLEMLKKNVKKKVSKWEKEKSLGIHTDRGYIILDAVFLKNTFALVRTSLEELIERYKQWDSSKKSKTNG